MTPLVPRWAERMIVALLFVFAFAQVAQVGVMLAPPAKVPTLALGTTTQVDASGTAPAPYTDPNRSINVALGAMGRTDGYLQQVTTTARDLMGTGAGGIPAVLQPELTSLPRLSTIRQIEVRLTALADTTNGAVCVRVGPTTDGVADDAPALNCPNQVAVADTGAGGCYLTATAQSCHITIRPILVDCTDYASCHIPIWARASAAGVGIVHVSMAW